MYSFAKLAINVSGQEAAHARTTRRRQTRTPSACKDPHATACTTAAFLPMLSAMRQRATHAQLARWRRGPGMLRRSRSPKVPSRAGRLSTVVPESPHAVTTVEVHTNSLNGGSCKQCTSHPRSNSRHRRLPSPTATLTTKTPMTALWASPTPRRLRSSHCSLHDHVQVVSLSSAALWACMLSNIGPDL